MLGEIRVIDATEQEGALVLSFRGRLDSGNSNDAEAIILDKLQNGAQRIVFDMSGLEYISSAGLRVVLTAAKRLKQVGGRMALCGMRPTVREVFSISGFLSFLVVCDSESEALSKVA